MERRAFLKFALASGAAGAFRVNAASAEEAPAGLANRLAALARELRGSVVDPADPRYAMLAQPWNAHFASVQPLAVVVVADESDVARTVAFARDEGVDFVVRNGGHSFAGYSACRGLVIDVRSLTAVDPDPKQATARVGAGWTNLPLYEALWPTRMAVPAGTCPTVGVTGLALGGGFGRLSPLYGLTSDNLLGVRMVSANGDILTADERENSDLLWACRGGGGGNFGVVTELTFRLRPVDMPFTDFNYVFGWQSALKVLSAWQDWIAELPREGHSDLQLVTGAPTAEGGATVKIDFTFAGDPARGEILARDFLAAAGAAPLTASRTTDSFLSTELAWGCAGMRPDECQFQGLSPDGKLVRFAIYTASDFVMKPWPEAGLEKLVEAIERRQSDRVLTPTEFEPGAQIGKVLIEACGGAINDTAPDATAFPHRGMLYVSQYQARWLPGADAATIAANIAWTRAMYDSVAVYRSGASYVNYTDPDLPEWPRAYYGANLPRLQQIKRKYDPNNLFRFPQSIPPT